jgi:hypothetical protein
MLVGSAFKDAAALRYEQHFFTMANKSTKEHEAFFSFSAI